MIPTTSTGPGSGASVESLREQLSEVRAALQTRINRLEIKLAEAMSLLKEIDDSGEINDNVWGTRLDLIYAKHKEHKP